MKVGPVHVVTDRTMAGMLHIMHGLQSAHDAAARERDAARAEQESARRERDAARRAHRAEVEALRHTTVPAQFLHHTAGATLPESVLLPPDADDDRCREAVRRVVAAYRRARADFRAPSRGLWEHIEGTQAEFISALDCGDERRAGDVLRRTFRTDAVWGLGYVAAATADDVVANPRANVNQLRIRDMLLGLASAVGAARVTNPEQSPAEHARPLAADPGPELTAAEGVVGFDVSMPEVGGNYGGHVAGKVVSADTLYHAYAVHRLAELGATPRHAFAEIGGGFGCMALLAHRAGFADYAIYDLPWVNALQGYFLIMALPETPVRLYGEDAGSLAVLPGWGFGGLAGRSVDWVINTNSLPEIGGETARNYVRDTARVAREGFYSINMESKTAVLDYGPQNCVAEMAAEVGGLRRASRHRYWMRYGYVEEVYRPVGTAGTT